MSLLNRLGLIDFSNKNLFSINETLFHQVDSFYQVIGANFSNNYLPKVPSNIQILPFLEYLDFSRNLLKTLSDLPLLNHLTILDISHNNLTCVELNICNLTSLRILNYSYNKLNSIPTQISNLKNLQKLYLESNVLTTFPESICLLNNLTVLNFSRNSLKNIPKKISNLTQLIHLDLSHNYITNIDVPFHKILTLKFLILDNNPLTFPPLRVVSLGSNAVIHFLSSSLEDYHLKSSNQSISNQHGIQSPSKSNQSNLKNSTNFTRSNHANTSTLHSISKNTQNDISNHNNTSNQNNTLTNNNTPILPHSTKSIKINTSTPTDQRLYKTSEQDYSCKNNFSPSTSSLSSTSRRSPSPRPYIINSKKSINQMKSIIEHRLSISIPPNVDFYKYISDGVILARLIKKYDKFNTYNIFIPISSSIPLKNNQKLHNINIFIKFCESNLGSLKNLCTSQQILSGQCTEEIEDTLSCFFDKYA